MSQQMKQVILELLERHGLKDAFLQASGGSFHARFENGGYLPLVVEKIDDDQVSVTHYGEQNGDAMYDPEMTFRLMGDEWQVRTFENSYLGTYQQVYPIVNGFESVHAALQRDLTSFATMWANNIRHQGWLGDCIKVSSITHQPLLDASRNPAAREPDAHLEEAYEDANGGSYEGID